MITPLRRRHRWLAPGAFALALAGLAVALAARPTAFVEATRRVEREVGVRIDEGGIVVDERGRFVVALEPGPPVRMWLVPHQSLDAPDLLVYLADEPGTGEALPPRAQLLGPASPTAPTEFSLAAAPRFVVLYSLGHAARFAAVDARGVLPEEPR